MSVIRLGAFPAVSARSRTEGRSYEDIHAAWRSGPWLPLRVTALMHGGVIGTPQGTVHLDAILSAAVMASPLVGATVHPRRESFVVPLPLMPVWVDDQGCPLWASSDLRPGGMTGRGEAYLHKRYPTDVAPLATKRTIVTTAGPMKDVRLPLAVTLADIWEGWCLGIAEPIRALLAGVRVIGRKGAIGYGRVAGWNVEPAEISLAEILDRRRVPLAALGSQPVPADRMVPFGGWTPPYWDARRHGPCREARWTP